MSGDSGMSGTIKLDERYIATSVELYQLTEKIMSHGATLDTRIPYHAVLAYFAVRAARIHWAIVRLCGEGMGPEGLILLRSFLNLLIDLKYVEGDRDARSRRYIRYGELIRAEAWHVYKRWHIDGPFISACGQKDQDHHEELEQELATYPALLKKEFPGRHRFGWADCSIKDRASRVGLEYAYDSVYRMGSKMDHVSPSSVRYFMEEANDGFRGRLAPMSELVPEVLISSCDYLYKVMQLWCAEFYQDGRVSLEDWNRSAAVIFSPADGVGEETANQ